MTRMLAGLVLVCAAAAQLPRIGDINVYGLHKITPETLLTTIHIAAGDPLPSSKGVMEDQLLELPEVLSAHVHVDCCEENRITLFVGIQERGEPGIAFHLPPSGEAALPADMIVAHDQYQGALLRASASSDDDAPPDPALRTFQNRFSAFAATQLDSLRDVLRNSWDHDQRRAAATMIGYAVRKKAVVEDLLFAVQDPDEGVRTQAARSLSAIALAVRKNPSLGIQIPPAPFVELLNSVVLSDRMESTKVLLTLTTGRSATVLAMIRERALPALVEMARWKTARYARPPFLLLGRLTGIPDAQIRQTWEKGDREALIQRALKFQAAARPVARKRRP